MRVISLVVIVVAVACSQSATHGGKRDGPHESMTDSVVLERTRCFGRCPAYRVRVGNSGEVVFVSHDPREDRRTAIDTVRGWVVDSLTIDAKRMDFFALPDSVVPGSPLCPPVATDHPAITIGVFGRDRSKSSIAPVVTCGEISVGLRRSSRSRNWPRASIRWRERIAGFTQFHLGESVI